MRSTGEIKEESSRKPSVGKDGLLHNPGAVLVDLILQDHKCFLQGVVIAGLGGNLLVSIKDRCMVAAELLANHRERLRGHGPRKVHGNLPRPGNISSTLLAGNIALE